MLDKLGKGPWHKFASSFQDFEACKKGRFEAFSKRFRLVFARFQVISRPKQLFGGQYRALEVRLRLREPAARALARQGAIERSPRGPETSRKASKTVGNR